MTDLDALKEDLAYLRERGDLAAALTATTAELYRLIEEVEQLRGERAAVVAWLRKHWSEVLEQTPQQTAKLIERGEHRREGER